MLTLTLNIMGIYTNFLKANFTIIFIRYDNGCGRDEALSYSHHSSNFSPYSPPSPRFHYSPSSNFSHEMPSQPTSPQFTPPIDYSHPERSQFSQLSQQSCTTEALNTSICGTQQSSQIVSQQHPAQVSSPSPLSLSPPSSLTQSPSKELLIKDITENLTSFERNQTLEFLNNLIQSFPKKFLDREEYIPSYEPTSQKSQIRNVSIFYHQLIEHILSKCMFSTVTSSSEFKLLDFLEIWGKHNKKAIVSLVKKLAISNSGLKKILSETTKAKLKPVECVVLLIRYINIHHSLRRLGVQTKIHPLKNTQRYH